MNIKDWIRQQLRPRLTKSTLFEKAKKVFPDITEYEIEKAYEEIFASEEDKQIERDLEFYKKEYERFRKRTDIVNEMVSLISYNITPFNKTKEQWKPSKTTNRSEETALFLNADAHIGFVVDELEAPATNMQYNKQVAEKRIKYYTEKFLTLTEERRLTRKMDNCYAVYDGDLVEGNFEKINISKDNIVEQIMIAGNIYANQLLALSQNYKNVYVKAIYGNHNVIQKGLPEYANFEYIMWRMVEEKCKNLKNVEFQIPTQPFGLFNIYDWGFCFTHGHMIKINQRTPFYGIESSYTEIKSVIEQMGNTFQYLILGHFHTPNILSVSGGKVIMCGSVCGYTPYALRTMAKNKYCPPSQFFCSVSPKHGIASWQCIIDLRDIGGENG
mgnify:FL=1